MTAVLDCAGRPLDLSRPRVMGILNVTPDSFSDGGRFLDPEKAVAQGLAMQAAGASLIDVGGESTRPGSQPVAIDEEIRRVVPVIVALHETLSIPVSIDTSKPQVMQAALEAGAGMINDVSALRVPGALELAAEAAVPICLMHMQGDPRSMQTQPSYRDVVRDVLQFLLERVAQAEAAGISRSRIVIDPGFGFGKTLQHNIALFQALDQFVATGLPLLVGLSRKSMLGQLSGAAVDERLGASVAGALLAVQKGASIVRVHDVPETVQALNVLAAIGPSTSGVRH